jgi:hypothetical protein
MLEVSFIVLNTYINPLTTLTMFREAFLRISAILNSHFNLLRASWIVLVHAFFKNPSE